MLARSAVRDLWHEGCGGVADAARGEVGHCATYKYYYYYYYYCMTFQQSEQHEWMINDESMQVYGKVLKAYRQELPAAYK